MKRLTVGAALVAATLATATAAAAGPYIGAAVGRSDYKIDCSGATSCDTKDAGYKVFGGWMFNDNVGVEASLFDLGRANGTAVVPGFGNVGLEARTRGVGVYGLAALPIDDFSVFAKAGLAYTRARVETTGALGGSDTDSRINVAYGLGASYAFTKSIGARVEWERFRVQFPGEQKENADLVTLGVTYRF